MIEIYRPIKYRIFAIEGYRPHLTVAISFKGKTAFLKVCAQQLHYLYKICSIHKRDKNLHTV